ncbi:hypothetical protein RRG08_053833 [Elysia crispata]|uniref:Uncharacterized protein n=1 Tax=Elysia crispata TaxID=231223 RepID=A0AAE1DVY0_9GAST|nr:hypothetical protein RRG08_053833 [Elysia crispata]
MFIKIFQEIASQYNASGMRTAAAIRDVLKHLLREGRGWSGSNVTPTPYFPSSNSSSVDLDKDRFRDIVNTDLLGMPPDADDYPP